MSAWSEYVHLLTAGQQAKAIAARVGVDTSQVSRWRSGKSVPSAENVIRFAAEYGGDFYEALRAAGYGDGDVLIPRTDAGDSTVHQLGDTDLSPRTTPAGTSRGSGDADDRGQESAEPSFDAELLKQMSLVALATTYNRNFTAPVQGRMEEMLRVLRGNLHTVRQLLLRDDDASVRGNAIEALNPADAAVTFLQQDLKTIESVVTSSDEPPYTPSDSRYPSLAQFLRQQIEEGRRNAVSDSSPTEPDASPTLNEGEEDGPPPESVYGLAARTEDDPKEDPTGE